MATLINQPERCVLPCVVVTILFTLDRTLPEFFYIVCDELFIKPANIFVQEGMNVVSLVTEIETGMTRRDPYNAWNNTKLSMEAQEGTILSA